MNIGKVYLVGAGPGDAGLMTVKGMEVLNKADVVLYDHLVGDALLAMLPENAELIVVGKHAGNHTMPQEKINELILEKALEGKMVVRLKGGDPFLFGRGGEELELLAKNNVPFTIIPGITSAISVPAYNGVPVTHRDFTSSLHIITGHKRKGSNSTIPYKALVDTEGTLVFLMGVSALADICQGLMDAGMSSDTPAGLFMRGTTAAQKRIVATVGTLAEECSKQTIVTPAIIVVGDVCKLHEDFAWFEKAPLSGKKIIVTRPKDRSEEIVSKLRALGAEVLSIPAISLEMVEQNDRLDDAVTNLQRYQWIAFTSPAGVRFFFSKLKKEKIDLRNLMHIKFAVIGEGSAKELEEYGFYADAMPEKYDGASLGAHLASICKKDERILLPRAKKGNQEIIQKLEGFLVDDIALYDTIYHVVNTIDQTALIESGDVDYVLFTSSSTVKSFVSANPALDMEKVTALCIGRQTMETAQHYHMKAFAAERATIDSLVELTSQMC